MHIAKEWSFKDKHVAEGFDEHVREQLPWYDLATQAVVHLARHYIPVKGKVYDIGASTGNITMALSDICFDRRANIISIEESKPMVEILNKRALAYCKARDCMECYGAVKAEDALDYNFEMYDFAVCFLTFMFFPITRRRAWLNKMRTLIKPGGALVVVDKIVMPSGYVGTVLRRLAMDWKLRNGASAGEIVAKELSLAGYQRPVEENMMFPVGTKFFQLGEFAGWVIERPE